MEINFVTVEELDRLIDGFSAEEKEELASRIFKKLSVQSRSRVIGLADSGLTIVTGSFVSLNSEIAVNIQNSNGGLNAEALVKALIEYKNQKK
jgi:hypothetical protein